MLVYSRTWNELSDEEKDIVCYWIEDLESGEFEQAFGTYRRDDAYCAIGLLDRVDRQARIIFSVFDRGNTIKLNDTDGYTFKEIAYIVREEMGIPDWV